MVVPAGMTMGGGASSCFGAAACWAPGLVLFAAAPVSLLGCEERHPYEASRAITQIHGESLAGCIVL
jgi:hypothetical protein